MRRQILPAIGLLLVLSALLGIAYPVVVWGIGQAAFNSKVNGSFVKSDGKVVASTLIGQSFLDSNGNPLRQYFQPRPSSAGAGYDSTASAASNLGPGDPRLIAKCDEVPADPTGKSKKTICSPNTVPQRAAAYRSFNGLPADAVIPVDAVTGSFSGLDPDISIANARLQAPRVARARHLPLAQVTKMIASHTTDRTLGFLGEDAVNVVTLNLALDQLSRS